LSENFTERRCHLTTSNPPTSKASGRPSNRLDSRPILGFAATSRYLGCGVILQGEVVLLKSRRMAVGGALSADLDRACEWSSHIVAGFMPSAVALLGVECNQSSVECGAACVADAIRRAASREGLVVADIDRFEIASLLGLRASTTVAIRIELARRSAFVAAHVTSRPGRSESDRYWQPAVLAAASALAMVTRCEPRLP